MPCYDPRDRQGEEDCRNRVDGMTALLCALAKGNDNAAGVLAEWYAHHTEMDRIRRTMPHGPERAKLLDHYGALCDAVLTSGRMKYLGVR